MFASITRTFIAVAIVSCAGSGAFAIDKPAGGHVGETIYRLNADAQYLEGCFEPCLCPISTSPINGTFVLGPEMIGDAFNFREVREVNWVVTKGAVQYTLQGSGGYYISNFGPPVMHSLELDLSINGDPITHFFSDLQPVTQNDGSIDLAVSMNGMFCFDTVVEVDASPVTHGVTRYGLGNASYYQHGCFDPCDCPLEQPRAMAGGFGLVPLMLSNQHREYALTRVTFHVGPGNNNKPPITLAGFGRLSLNFAANSATQRLVLTLHDGDPNSLAMHFDSGNVPMEANFPLINALVDMNGQVCLDTVLHITSAPAPNNANGGEGLSKPRATLWSP